MSLNGLARYELNNFTGRKKKRDLIKIMVNCSNPKEEIEIKIEKFRTAEIDTQIHQIMPQSISEKGADFWNGQDNDSTN